LCHQFFSFFHLLWKQYFQLFFMIWHDWPNHLWIRGPQVIEKFWIWKESVLVHCVPHVFDWLTWLLMLYYMCHPFDAHLHTPPYCTQSHSLPHTVGIFWYHICVAFMSCEYKKFVPKCTNGLISFVIFCL
jgi:hypothetical protein